MENQLRVSWIFGALIAGGLCTPFYGQPTTAVSYVRDDTGLEHWTVASKPGEVPRFFREYGQHNGITLPSSADDLPFGRSVAFLIGIGTYDHLDQLKGVPNSLKHLREYLLSSGGFDEVYELSEASATPRAVRNLMRKTFAKLDNGTRFLFYFAGHGTDLNASTGYLLFKGAQPTDPADEDNSIATNEIREWSVLMRAKHVLFLLDACSAGFGYESFTSQGDVDLLSSFTDKPSRWIVTAGTGNQDTFDIEPLKGEPITVFGQSLLLALTDSRATGPYSSFLTLGQVFEDLRLHETEFANQQNQLLRPDRYPLRGGAEFVFLNPKPQSGNISKDIIDRLGAKPDKPLRLPAQELSSWRDVSITLGDRQRQGRHYQVNLGPVPRGRDQKLTLAIANLTSDPRLVSVRVEGNGIDAAFEGAAWSTVVGKAASKLEVSISGEVNDIGRIVGIAGNQEIFDVSFIRELKPEMTEIHADSGDIPSGPGKSFSAPRELCLDAKTIPVGYEIVKDSAKYSLTGDRTCGNWSTCGWSTDKTNLKCVTVTLQGHDENLFNGGVRNSQAHITAQAKLIGVAPALSVTSTP